MITDRNEQAGTITCQSPSGAVYISHEPAAAHERLWGRFSGTLAFDIGANTGQSLAAAVASGRFARAVACEPGREAFSQLSCRWSADLRVILHQVAVSDHDGTMELVLGRRSNGELLCPDLIGRSPDPWFSQEAERREVPCVTLDTLAGVYGMPGLVKVDTEGSEVLILQGGRSLLGRAEWLVEWHSPALREACLQILAGYDTGIIEYPYPDGKLPYPGGEPQNGWLLATLPSREATR